MTKLPTISNAAALLSTLLIACGGGADRPATAPPLPQPEMNAPCSEFDEAADGSIDFTYRYAYDDDGFMLRYVGVPADVGDFQYDANHFVVHYTNNQDSDAEIEYEETYTRDADGRILTFNERDDGGTIANRTTASRTYGYDNLGRLVRSEVTETTMTGSVTNTTIFTYSGNKLNPSSAILTYAAGTTSIVYTSSSDERTLHADLDDGSNGTVDRTTDVTYDDQGRTLTQIDRTKGSVTARVATVYNGQGATASLVRANTEAPPDDWVYGARFDLLGMMTDRDGRSPSGQYSSSVYSEVAKSQCVTPTATANRPAPPSGHRFRHNAARDLPAIAPL